MVISAQVSYKKESVPRKRVEKERTLRLLLLAVLALRLTVACAVRRWIQIRAIRLGETAMTSALSPENAPGCCC